MSESEQVELSDLVAYVPQIANELKISARQVVATAELIERGGTVPFIARYRKEATNGRCG